MYEPILFLILIAWVFLIIRGYIKLDKISIVSTSVFLIIAILALIPQIPEIQSWFNETFSESLGAILLVVLLIFLMMCIVLSSYFFRKAFDSAVRMFYKKNLTVSISNESKKYIGGALIFEIVFSGSLEHGYFQIIIRSPYWEEESVLVKYDHDKKIGLLKGQAKDQKIKLKCPIPKNFSGGEYEILVNIIDVSSTIFFKYTHKIISKTLKTTIDEQS